MIIILVANSSVAIDWRTKVEKKRRTREIHTFVDRKEVYVYVYKSRGGAAGAVAEEEGDR